MKDQGWLRMEKISTITNDELVKKKKKKTKAKILKMTKLRLTN